MASVPMDAVVDFLVDDLFKYEQIASGHPCFRFSGVDPREAFLIAYLRRALTYGETLEQLGRVRDVLGVMLETVGLGIVDVET